MIIFLDTSAWIKYYIEEKGTSEIQKFILQQSSSDDIIFSTSVITYAEMRATFKRAINDGRISIEQFSHTKNEFDMQWKDLDIPQAGADLIKSSGRLAEKYSLKGCDAFQLASALAIKAELFVNSDHELTKAAKDNNLAVWNPVEGEYAGLAADENAAA